MSEMSGNEKYRFKFPGTRALIGSRLKFYNAGNDFYYAVYTQKNAVLLSVSSDKAKNFSDPKEILQINHDLVDVQFIAIKEKFAVAITEKAPDSTIVRAAYGNFDVASGNITSTECPKRHVFPQGVVLHVQLFFVDYEKGESEEHVFVQIEEDTIEEETGRHP